MYSKNYSYLNDDNINYNNYKEKEKDINNKNDKVFNKAITIISYNLLEYLTEEEKQNLKLVNKHVMDIVDCEELFKTSINSLGKLFYKENLFEDEDLKNKPPEKISKFKEKFTFNKSLNELYKNSEEKIPSIMKKTRK